MKKLKSALKILAIAIAVIISIFEVVIYIEKGGTIRQLLLLILSLYAWACFAIGIIMKRSSEVSVIEEAMRTEKIDNENADQHKEDRNEETDNVNSSAADS